MQTQYYCKRTREEVPDILGTSHNFLKSCNNTTKFSRLLTRGCKQNSNALYFCSDIFWNKVAISCACCFWDSINIVCICCSCCCICCCCSCCCWFCCCRCCWNMEIICCCCFCCSVKSDCSLFLASSPSHYAFLRTGLCRCHLSAFCTAPLPLTHLDRISSS